MFGIVVLVARRNDRMGTRERGLVGVSGSGCLRGGAEVR